jgi:ketosteroid isomerase-like protein
MQSASTVEDALQLAPEVQRLLDEAAIRRVHLDYCRGIDRRDWELVRSCYHPDAIDYHGPFEGGVEEFIEWAVGLMDDVAMTMHFVGNQIVDVDDDVAWHEAYCLAFHRLTSTEGSPAVDWVVNVRYLDKMERRDGRWKIADRLVVHDLDRRDLVAGSGEISPGWFPGGFSPDDASYNRSATWAEFLAERRSRS